jgi:MFS family permease
VTPSIIADFGITWPFFVYVIVVANLVGAFASLIAGLADRWGRSNLVTYGLFVTAMVVLFGLPNAPNLWAYAVLFCTLGFVEGIILVATPALVRDFSPQLGRGLATGSGRWDRSSPASPWRWCRATPSITSTPGRTSSSSAASSA